VKVFAVSLAFSASNSANAACTSVEAMFPAGVTVTAEASVLEALFNTQPTPFHVQVLPPKEYVWFRLGDVGKLMFGMLITVE